MAVTVALEVELAGIGAGWTDISADLAATPIRTSRGFQSTGPDDLVAAPASMTFALNNSVHNSAATLGYYSPDSSSVRSGWAVGVRCRLKITANGNTRVRFFGWVEEITPQAGLYDGDQVVDVSAMSWLNQAATAPIAGLTPQISQRGDQLVSTILAQAQMQPPATSYATGIDTYPYAFFDLDPATAHVLDGLDSIAKSGLDRIYEKADGTLCFESRQTRETYTLPVLTLTDVAPANQPGLAVTGVPARRPRAQLLNRFQVTVHPVKVDGSPVVLYSLSNAASLSAIGVGQTITMQCPYVDPNQLAQQVGGFNMLISNGAGGSTIGSSGNLPTADYQFFSGASGAGSDVSSSMAVTVVYATRQATITIKNNGTVPAYYYKLQCRGQGIYDYQTFVGIASNATSISAQGQTTTSVDCPYNADPFFAASAAAYLTKANTAAISQLDQGIQAFCHAGDEVTLDSLLANLEISAPVQISETVTGLSAGVYWVNGEILEVDERGNVTLTYPLAPSIASAVWTLGVAHSSEIGTTTYLGF